MSTIKNEKIPSRYTLAELYTGIHRQLTDLGFQPRTLVEEKTRELKLPPEAQKVFDTELAKFSPAAQFYLRTLNDQTRYFLGDELMHVALILNELLPRFTQREAMEQETYEKVSTFPPDTLISASELAFDHLAKESPAYIRRLLTSAIQPGLYSMTPPKMKPEEIAEMELISAQWVLENKKYDEDALKVMSMVGPDGKPAELKKSGVARFNYISELMPKLLAVSNFRRADSSHFSRFVNLLPSVLLWFLGNPISELTSADEDPVMDLLEASITFNKTLQTHAEQAGRVRQMLHHGFPVYKDLMTLAHAQTQLMSWNFESILYRFSMNLPTILKVKEAEEPIVRLLMACGVLTTYARHKNAYIKHQTSN